MDESASSRYSRQLQLRQIGNEGQARLRRAWVSIVGVGALGSIQASYLVRAGVGRLRLIDRDVLELHNLQRQVLYTEEDVARRLPKAVAAERHLRTINSDVNVDAFAEHLSSGNIAEMLSGSHLILDGTDNFETRFLLNDYCVQTGLPWIYGACVGSAGLCMVILPGRTACLRCLIDPVSPSPEPTCDTMGILGPLPGVVGSYQAAQAIRLLSGGDRETPQGVLRFDAWEGTARHVLKAVRPHPECPCCHGRRFEYLKGRAAASAYVLCGRNAVQIVPAGKSPRDLEALERMLRNLGKVTRNRYLLEARIEDYTFTVFPHGRIIVGGTSDPGKARSLVDRYLGGS